MTTMTNPQHLSLLTYEQIKRLITIMDQTINSINANGRESQNFSAALAAAAAAAAAAASTGPAPAPTTSTAPAGIAPTGIAPTEIAPKQQQQQQQQQDGSTSTTAATSLQGILHDQQQLSHSLQLQIQQHLQQQLMLKSHNYQNANFAGQLERQDDDDDDDDDEDHDNEQQIDTNLSANVLSANVHQRWPHLLAGRSEQHASAERVERKVRDTTDERKRNSSANELLMLLDQNHNRHDTKQPHEAAGKKREHSDDDDDDDDVEIDIDVDDGQAQTIAQNFTAVLVDNRNGSSRQEHHERHQLKRIRSRARMFTPTVHARSRLLPIGEQSARRLDPTTTISSRADRMRWRPFGAADDNGQEPVTTSERVISPSSSAASSSTSRLALPTDHQHNQLTDHNNLMRLARLDRVPGDVYVYDDDDDDDDDDDEEQDDEQQQQQDDDECSGALNLSLNHRTGKSTTTTNRMTPTVTSSHSGVSTSSAAVASSAATAAATRSSRDNMIKSVSSSTASLSSSSSSPSLSLSLSPSLLSAHQHQQNHHRHQQLVTQQQQQNHHQNHQSRNNQSVTDTEELERIRAFIEDFKIRRAALGLTQKQAAQCFRAYTDDRFAFSDNFVGHFEGFQFRPQTAATIAQSLAEWLEFVERETRLGRQLMFMPGRVKETRKRKFEVIRIRDAAKRILVEAFELNRSPSAVELGRLSVTTGIPTRNIEIWFKNRRTSQQYKH